MVTVEQTVQTVTDEVVFYPQSTWEIIDLSPLSINKNNNDSERAGVEMVVYQN